MATKRKQNRRLGFLAYQRDLHGFIKVGSQTDHGLTHRLEDATVFLSPEAALGEYRRIRGDEEAELIAFQVFPLYEEVTLRAGNA